MEDYCKNLKVSDFPSWDDYLEERVKRGLAAGYNFNECYGHWLEEFFKLLCDASDGSTPSKDQTK